MTAVHEFRELEPRSQRVARRLRGFLAEEQVPALRLAEALNLTQSKIARRMTGHVAFSVDELDAICQALGIRFEWLTTGYGPTFDPEGGDESLLTDSNRRPLAYMVVGQPGQLITVDFAPTDPATIPAAAEAA